MQKLLKTLLCQNRRNNKLAIDWPIVDIHNHALPMVDDGARNFAMSLKMLENLEVQNVQTAILTPHYIIDTGQMSSRGENRKILMQLQKRAQKIGLKIQLYQGNEIYIDAKIANLLRGRKICPLADGKYLLVELPMTGIFPDYLDVLIGLKQQGWRVILAHPERYLAMQKSFARLGELSRSGILFQCNYGSFLGKYGRGANRTARKLARKKMIFTFGSDMHRPQSEPQIRIALEKLRRFYNMKELRQLTYFNPQKILQSK